MVLFFYYFSRFLSKTTLKMNSSTLSNWLLVFVFCIAGGSLYAQTGGSQCGTLDSTVAHYLINYSKKADLSKARVTTGEKLEYRLALDINYATYLLYDGDKEWIKRVAYKFIDDASRIFEREINVKLTVTSILIWDKPEPYQLIGDYDYFNNVNNYWIQNRTDEYDALVGLSVRYGWFYGGYRMCTSNFPEPNNQVLAPDLLCHELGHTLGSPHTHNCSWPGGPIDYCEALEGCGSTNYREYGVGSLMSYCRSILSFHPLCRNLMRDYADGKVNASFKLNALDKTPASSGPPILRNSTTQATSNTPEFEWSAPKSVEYFRFQISRNTAFTDPIEDTLITQSYFRSSGLGEGSYYARYSSSNSTGNAEWSSSLSFSVPAFTEASSAPILLNAILHNDATVAGYFKKYPETNSYQVEIVNEYNNSQRFVHQLSMSGESLQSFSIPLLIDPMGRFSVRIRVGKDQRWSKWSDKTILIAPWNNELWKLTNVSGVSGTPVVAVSLYRPTFSSIGTTQCIEIAVDSSFKHIVFKDSLISYQINDWYNNKAIFTPKLDDNQSYYVRTRLNYEPGFYSKWKSYQLTTGTTDRRFEFWGTVSKNLQSTNSTFSDYQSLKLYKKGTGLYVHSLSGGYYVTNDLKNWKAFTTSTTQGRIPNQSNLFGIADDGGAYLFDQNGTLLKNSQAGATQYYRYPGNYLYVPNLTPAWDLKNDGVMFRTEILGVVHVNEGEWKLYTEEVFGTARSIYLAADSEGRVWNVMQGGNVWTYRNSKWTMDSYFPQWSDLWGIGFDSTNACYLYGGFGVAKLNESHNWEIIPALAGIPVRKIAFDTQGQMWIASYRHNGLTYTSYALIKLKEQKTSVYSDGLNFLKEPFDIEIFNDKLVILTAGGEIQTFDETLIQAFVPGANYCPGEEFSFSLTTNSTFSKENKISILLTNTTTGQSRLISEITVLDKLVKAQLPVDITSGSYKMVVNTTHPEIQSNVEGLLHISEPISATIKQEPGNTFTTRLIAPSGEGLTYKWQLNGSEIATENSAFLEVYSSGSYNVEITTKQGCRSVSDTIEVQIAEPNEVTLLQNVPNPVTTTSELAFYLTGAENTTLELYSSNGRAIKTLKSGLLQKGWYRYTLDTHGLSSGIYLCSLTTGSTKKTIKIIRL